MGPLVTPEDHDAGFKELALEYRRSPAPEDAPATIRIRALSYVEAAAISGALHTSRVERATGPSVEAIRLDENIWRLSVLLAAMPDPHNKVEFVNQLKPTCVDRLMLIALHLAYGAPESEPKSEDTKKNPIDSEITVPA